MSIITKLTLHTQVGSKTLFLGILFAFLGNMTGYSQTNSKEVVHSVYVTSNTGLRSNEDNKQILDQIVKSSQAGESNSLVMVGNIVPQSGFPDKDDGRSRVEADLKKNLLDKIKFIGEASPKGPTEKILGDCSVLDFPEGSFDTVCNIFLLQHLGKTNRKEQRAPIGDRKSTR